MINKATKRQRRSRKTRSRIQRAKAVRLSVHRSLKHIYAQVISPCGGVVLASASTLDKELRDKVKCGSNVAAAEQVGTALAERAIKAGVKTVAFDRSGYKYHGRVAKLAQAARDAGLEF